MKFFAIAGLPTLLAQGALAFVSPSPRRPKATTALEAEKERVSATTAVSACALGLGLAVQAAFADDAAVLGQQPQYRHSTSVASSATIVAEIDKFTLPSYDAAKGSTLIDISGDLETVNRKTLAQAKARREYADRSAEKLETDALRKAEKDGSSLFDSMIGESAKEQKARIEAEKAEARANRWKTF
jgi:hypothetical protein